MTSPTQGSVRERAASLVEILRHRASHQADRTAYVFLTDASGEEVRLTYGDLDRSARRVAARLQRDTLRGERVLMFYPTGPEFVKAFFGCLYAGVIGIPLFPPRPNRGMGRLRAIAEDAGCGVALAPDRIWTEVEAHRDSNPDLQGLRGVATDILPAGLEDDWVEPGLAPEDTAYLQYTSGSTSTPRGVVVSHGNLLYNCGYIGTCWRLGPDTRAVTWLPHAHDMGLIDGLLNPLVHGFPVRVLSPASFVRSPIRWLRAVHDARATHSGGPNFSYDLCIRRVAPEQRSELDLSSWLTAYCGAEPIRRDTLERFAEAFSVSGFRRSSLCPGYGLAEGTLMVSGSPLESSPVYTDVDVEALQKGRVVPASAGEEGTQPIVGCGEVFHETGVAIVDPETRRRCASDHVGEIWVSGPTIAGGYWGRPEESAATFAARIEGEDTGPFLRTGDLGFLSGGVLHITGRRKDLIIIRGYNHYPQDIEWAAERAHPAVRAACSAAFSIDADAEEHLVITAEIDRRQVPETTEGWDEIVRVIRLAIFDQFEIDVHAVQFLRQGSIHKTTSGKIRRFACRQDFLAGNERALWTSTLPTVARKSGAQVPTLDVEALRGLAPQRCRRAVESHLMGLAAHVLGIPRENMDRNAPLGSYGLDSLKGSEMVALAHDRLGVHLPNAALYNHPTIAQLAIHVTGKLGLADGPVAVSSGSLADRLAVDGERAIEILTRAHELEAADLQAIRERTRQQEQTS